MKKVNNPAPVVDFAELVPPPPVRPVTPVCEHSLSYKTCHCRSSHKIDGKHYCRQHAGPAALRYLDKLAKTGASQ